MELQDLIFTKEIWTIDNTLEAPGGITSTSYGVKGSPRWSEFSVEAQGSVNLTMPREKFDWFLTDDIDEECLVDCINDAIYVNKDELTEIFGGGFDAYEPLVSVTLGQNIEIIIEHGEERADYDIEEEARYEREEALSDLVDY